MTAVLVALAVAAPSGAAATAKPIVRLTDYTPVTISGARFRAGERVTVRVVMSGTVHARKAKATRVGTFTTVFAGLSHETCGSIAVRAVGGHGSVATLAMKPPPSCPVPPQPVDR